MRRFVIVLSLLMLGCQAEPRLAKLTPYHLSPELTGVEGLQPLEERSELAENACWLGPGEHLDFYEAYLLNPAPFITSDSLFHAYQSLLNDTLVEFHETVRDPLEERLRTELGLAHLDEPLPYQSDSQLARCVALSNQLRASPDWPLYERIRRLDRELAGSADDPGPESFLDGRPPVVAARVVDRGVPVEGMRIMPQGLTLKNLLVVIVPYQGRLYWSEGAVYSYYEFDRPMDDPAPPWKEWMGRSFEQQPVKTRGIRWGDGSRR